MDFLFRQPLGGAPGDVIQGARNTSHSDHGNGPQGVVGLPLPTAIEPVPTHPPVALTGAFGKDDAKQRQWQAFVHKGRLDAGTLGDTVELPPYLVVAREPGGSQHQRCELDVAGPATALGRRFAAPRNRVAPLPTCQISSSHRAATRMDTWPDLRKSAESIGQFNAENEQRRGLTG